MVCGEPHVFVSKGQIAASLYDDDALDRIKLRVEARVFLKRSASRTGTLRVRSTCPDWMAATRAEGSLMIWNVTFFIFGFGPQ